MKKNTIFEKNFNAIKFTNPQLAKQITESKPEKLQLVKQNPSFEPDIAFENNKFYYGGNPKITAFKELSNNEFKNPKLLLFLGFGLGYHISEYINNTKWATKTLHILIVEKDLDILKAGLSVTDLSNLILAKKITIIAGHSIDNLYLHIFNFCNNSPEIKLMAKSIDVVAVSGALRLDKNYYVTAMKFLREAINQTLQNYGNSPEDSFIGLENMLNNIKTTVSWPGIIDFENKFAGKPAVLVAAGPSLEKNIDLLHKIKDKAFIIAVDTSLRIMLKRGIYPHMVTSIERGISTLKYYTDLEEFLPELRKTYFAPATIVRKELYDKCVDEYKMKPMIVYRDFAHYKWLKVDKGIINSGKSSANLAFKMLVKMGFKTIILIGQDLAFGENEKTHISGADHSIEGMKKSYKIKETMWVKGNYQEKIKTIKTWYHFLRYYEQDIAQFDGIVINATEGGAFIQGTKIMTFKEAIDKYLTKNFDFFEILDKGFEKFSQEKIKEDTQTIKKVLKETKDFTDKIITLCNKGLELSEQFKKELEEKTQGKAVAFTEFDSEWINGYAKKMMGIKNEIVNNNLFYLFMMHIIQSYIIRTEIEINALPGRYSHQNEIDAFYIKIMIEWFNTILGITQIAQKHLDKASEIIEK